MSVTKAHGNDITRKLEDGQIRIGFQNARGIEYDLRRPASEMIQAAKENNIGIYGIVEPNCSFNTTLVRAIGKAINKEFPTNGFITYASMPSTKQGYLPGGSIQAITGGMVGRHVQSGGDKYGRFSWAKFMGKNGEKFLSITAYRVGQKKGSKPESADSITAHWQQVQAMTKAGQTEPDPRNQVLTDLSRFMDESRSEGYEIILGIDANEAMEAKDSGIMKFAEKNGLHDIHEAVVRDLPLTTRIGSRRRIDFVFATEKILQWVRAAGYGAIDDGIQSDHILLWADIDFGGFFGGNPTANPPQQSRPFTFENVEIRNKFIEHLKVILDNQNVKSRIKKLELELELHGVNKGRIRQYNVIDNDITKAVKAAVKKTIKTKQHGCPRSKALTEAGNNVLYWKSLLSSANNEIPITEKAKKLGDRLGLDTSKSGELTSKQLDRQTDKAWRDLKECQANATELRKQWLESKARYKATVEGDEDAERVLKTMVRNMEEKQMHRNLTYITKGAHERLSWIEAPTGNWY